MDTLTTKIIVKSATGDAVEFDAKICELCDLINNMPDKSQPLTTDISTELLNLIKQFAEKHSYDKKSMTYEFPTISNSIKANISDKSFELLKDHIVEGSISETAKRLAPLINAADVLRFRKLYTTLNIILVTLLHIEESEKGVKEFMDNHNLKEDEDFSAEKINQAIQENNELFELVVARFAKNVEELDRIQGVTD
ncbi:hypothetical protein ABPG72_011206 [Tetrahymena utriculariae]